MDPDSGGYRKITTEKMHGNGNRNPIVGGGQSTAFILKVAPSVVEPDFFAGAGAGKLRGFGGGKAVTIFIILVIF